ncbi:hypothetical protein AS188_15765 (plasmid) [Kocuria flava]|uniref:HTH tetR-type domain-containing protein n=1 Tax=Kocuria flava TaxID=446860 RepID=A0A0U3HEF8_9MICC|nr:TetR/AcrR family transcriptional regulator [Kocuria flava]ALU41349.1 hypothetical protein AS188_15765 [Kocuria flava]GEO93192.1 hypothetical protein KFL01_24980 [Kocuria flava]
MKNTMTVPPQGLRDKAKTERLRRIRAAAEELFSERGYEHTTTKEIAEAAEVGEATLFRYVTSKHELLLLVLGERMDKVIQVIKSEDLRRAPTSCAPADYVDRIYAIFKARAEFYTTDPENVLKYLQYGLTAGSQLGAESIRQGDEIIALTKSVLDQAREAGLLLPFVDTWAVAQNCNGIYIHEVLRTPVRKFGPHAMWDRIHERVAAQIEPLFPGIYPPTC